MSFISELPSGKYKVNLGETFSDKPNKEILTMRYDFMPASVDENDKYVVSDPEKQDHVAVVVPKIENGVVSAKDSTIFKGQKKKGKGKDCVLMYDHDKKQFVLHVLSTSIGLKQQRGDTEHLTDAVQKYIESKTAPAMEESVESEKNDESDNNEDDSSDIVGNGNQSDDDVMSSSSASNAGSDSDGEEDPLEQALKKEMENINVSSSAETTAAPPVAKKPALASTLHNDLHLSDSSDED